MDIVLIMSLLLCTCSLASGMILFVGLVSYCVKNETQDAIIHPDNNLPWAHSRLKTDQKCEVQSLYITRQYTISMIKWKVTDPN